MRSAWAGMLVGLGLAGGALARVTRKRARLEAAFPTLRADAGAPR